MAKLKCKNGNCKHSDQDKLHGEKIRVHNETAKPSREGMLYRCTVCGEER